MDTRAAGRLATISHPRSHVLQATSAFTRVSRSPCDRFHVYYVSKLSKGAASTPTWKFESAAFSAGAPTPLQLQSLLKCHSPKYEAHVPELLLFLMSRVEQLLISNRISSSACCAHPNSSHLIPCVKIDLLSENQNRYLSIT